MLRQDTILFQSFVKLDSDFSAAFTLPKHVGTFRVTLLSFDEKGNYGIHESHIRVQQPLVAYATVPQYLSAGESLWLNVGVLNNTDAHADVSLMGRELAKLDVAPKASTVHSLTYTAEELPAVVEAYGGGNKSKVVVAPQVLGYTRIDKSTALLLDPRAGLLSGGATFTLPDDIVKGTLTCTAYSVFPSLSLVLDGLEHLIREPHGCFEQTSCTTFPLVFLLQYLQCAKQGDAERKMWVDATRQLKAGIKRLLGYECSTGGFEWFGQAPGHVTLTAYGIWQFREMARVDASLLDKQVVERSVRWLKQQYKAGEFKVASGLDSFGNPPQQLSDIYVVYALADAAREDQAVATILAEQVRKLEADKQSSGDPYALALLGLTLHAVGEKVRSEEVLGRLKGMQNAATGAVESAQTSITRSCGTSLLVETTALCALLAIELDILSHEKFIAQCTEYLLSVCANGFFASTQGTVLALKAIITYMQKAQRTPIDALVQLDVCGSKHELLVNNGEKSAKTDNRLVVPQPQLGGASQLSVAAKVAEADAKACGKFQVNVDVSYEVRVPRGVSDSPLQLSARRADEGDVAQATFTLRNAAGSDQGMAVLIVNKQSEHELNLVELENLRVNGTVDFYELAPRNAQLILYWRALAPHESKTVTLSFTRQHAVGNSMRLFHRAYLYYDREGSEVFAEYN